MHLSITTSYASCFEKTHLLPCGGFLGVWFPLEIPIRCPYRLRELDDHFCQVVPPKSLLHFLTSLTRNACVCVSSKNTHNKNFQELVTALNWTPLPFLSSRIHGLNSFSREVTSPGVFNKRGPLHQLRIPSLSRYLQGVYTKTMVVWE